MTWDHISLVSVLVSALQIILRSAFIKNTSQVEVQGLWFKEEANVCTVNVRKKNRDGDLFTI